MDKLTDEQVENWCKILSMRFGVIAYLAPREDIERYVAKLQAKLKPCECDPVKHGVTKHLDGSVTCNNCGKERKL